MKHVPFFSNTDDNLHCYQACLKMVLKYFLPQKDFSFETLDELSGQKKGLWTWPMSGASYLVANGLHIEYIYNFDYKKFINVGIEYFREKYGQDVTESMDVHAGIDRGRQQAVELFQCTTPIVRTPTISDIQKILSASGLAICWVNAFVFQNKPGVEGHFVVVYDVQDTTMLFHDPGLPPREAVQMSTIDFEKAWGYPNDDAKLCIGVSA